MLISVNLYAQNENLLAPGDAGGGTDIQLSAGDEDSADFAENVAADTAAADPAVDDADKDAKTNPVKEKDQKTADKNGTTEQMSALSAMSSATGSSSTSEWGVTAVEVTQIGNSGAAATNIPIIVPPGRKGMEPRISLHYNSGSGNGWIGVGWGLDMGAIQRSTKRGVNYTANEFVATVNGSAAELVSRGDWGPNYYGAKIEGALSKYYQNPSTGGWELNNYRLKDGRLKLWTESPDTGRIDPS